MPIGDISGFHHAPFEVSTSQCSRWGGVAWFSIFEDQWAAKSEAVETLTFAARVACAVRAACIESAPSAAPGFACAWPPSRLQIYRRQDTQPEPIGLPGEFYWLFFGRISFLYYGCSRRRSEATIGQRLTDKTLFTDPDVGRAATRIAPFS
jgi:hypothetical protein